MIDKNSDLYISVENWFEHEEEKRKLWLEKYPPNPPNQVCNHAFLYGISIENSFEPLVGEFNLLFKTEFEDIYIWTYIENTNSAMIAKTNLNVKNQKYWKTIANIIMLAIKYAEAFESNFSGYDIIDCKWMYYFNFSASKINDLVFYGLDDIECSHLSNAELLKQQLYLI